MTLHNPTTVGGKAEAKIAGRENLIGLESHVMTSCVRKPVQNERNS